MMCAEDSSRDGRGRSRHVTREVTTRKLGILQKVQLERENITHFVFADRRLGMGTFARFLRFPNNLELRLGLVRLVFPLLWKMNFYFLALLKCLTLVPELYAFL